MTNLNQITLIIPAKEERHCLTGVISELKKYKINKIIVIPKNKKCTYINEKKTKILNQDGYGYGNALKLGIKKTQTKYFCIFNADGSFNPTEILGMYSLLKKEHGDIIFASRYQGNAASDDDTIITRVGNFLFSFF